MISVIVAVYNVEKYIENTLKSIVNQDYANFELIAVDDGSTDKSVEIINKYLKGTKINWQLITIKNGGQSNARNVGLQHSKGEYVVFIDSDDVIANDFLSKLKDALDKNECDFSFCNFKFVNKQIPPISNDYSERIFDKNELLESFLKRNINFVVPSMMFKKSFLVNNKLLFNENIRFSEDQMFIWMAIINSTKSVYLSKQMYGYYLREKSIMTSSPYKKIMNSYDVYKKFVSELDNQYNNYHSVIKYILPRWELGTLYSASKLVDYNEFTSMYDQMNGRTIYDRLIGMGEIKASLLSFVSKISPRLLFEISRKMK